MPFFLCVCLDYLATELKASVYIDGISASLIKTVNQRAISVSELFVHDVENMFTNIESFEHFVFIKLRVGAAGQVGVTDKGLKQYKLIVPDLLHVLHVTPPDASITWRRPVMIDSACQSMMHATRY
jgi:hypothetical protein